MQIIPVIDLIAGQVVRARRGSRADYRPIVSPLAATSAPDHVVAGLMGVFAFTTVYVADLDAIEGRRGNSAAVAALAAAFPAARFWLDAGRQAAGPADDPTDRLDRILGSESLDASRPPPDLSSWRGMLLSLDFRGDAFLGPPALASQPALWPRRVIVMTLSRVGVDEGPDFGRLAAVKAAAGRRQVFAAGGVRDARDIERLASMGISGALVASALHDGRLSGDDIARLQRA